MIGVEHIEQGVADVVGSIGLGGFFEDLIENILKSMVVLERRCPVRHGFDVQGESEDQHKLDDFLMIAVGRR